MDKLGAFFDSNRMKNIHYENGNFIFFNNPDTNHKHVRTVEV